MDEVYYYESLLLLLLLLLFHNAHFERNEFISVYQRMTLAGGIADRQGVKALIPQGDGLVSIRLSTNSHNPQSVAVICKGVYQKWLPIHFYTG